MPKGKGKDDQKKVLTEKADGTHQPDCGTCGGKVTGGSCSRCGADSLGQKNIRK